MPTNHLLTYYAILGTVGNELDAACGQGSYEDDNGQRVTVAEARPVALGLLDTHIQRLQQLRADVEKLPIKQLEAKWGGGGDGY